MALTEERIVAVEDALIALGNLEFGDVPGHVFHGNQHVDGTAYGIARGRLDDLKMAGAARAYLMGAQDAVNEYQTGAPVNAKQRADEEYTKVARVEGISRGPGTVADPVYNRGVADIHATVANNPPGDKTMFARPSPIDRHAMADALAREQEGLLEPGRAWSARVTQAESAFLALAHLEFGDDLGHEFRGNQYTGGSTHLGGKWADIGSDTGKKTKPHCPTGGVYVTDGWAAGACHKMSELSPTDAAKAAEAVAQCKPGKAQLTKATSDNIEVSCRP